MYSFALVVTVNYEFCFKFMFSFIYIYSYALKGSLLRQHPLLYTVCPPFYLTAEYVCCCELLVWTQFPNTSRQCVTTHSLLQYSSSQSELTIAGFGHPCRIHCWGCWAAFCCGGLPDSGGATCGLDEWGPPGCGCCCCCC